MHQAAHFQPTQVVVLHSYIFRQSM